MIESQIGASFGFYLLLSLLLLLGYFFLDYTALGGRRGGPRALSAGTYIYIYIYIYIYVYILGSGCPLLKRVGVIGTASLYGPGKIMQSGVTCSILCVSSWAELWLVNKIFCTAWG